MLWRQAGELLARGGCQTRGSHRGPAPLGGLAGLVTSIIPAGLSAVCSPVQATRGRVVTIRPERVDDASRVRQVNELAFGQPTEAALIEKLRRACKDWPQIVLTAFG